MKTALTIAGSDCSGGAGIQADIKTIQAHGVFAMSAYGLVIYAMSLGAMGMVSALRETSVIMAAVIGVLFLKERVTVVRIVAIVLVVMGVLLMHQGR